MSYIQAPLNKCKFLEITTKANTKTLKDKQYKHSKFSLEFHFLNNFLTKLENVPLPCVFPCQVK